MVTILGPKVERCKHICVCSYYESDRAQGSENTVIIVKHVLTTNYKPPFWDPISIY